MRLKEEIKLYSNNTSIMVEKQKIMRNGGATRNSNLELYRIIMMVLIVAHHLVVNSNMWATLSENDVSWKSYYFYILSAWGKPAIDGFILITGFFMCRQDITMYKYIKLLSQILFYNIVIYLIFIFCSRVELSPISLFYCLMPFSNVDKGFSGCFLLFYLFIPYLSKLVNCLNKKEHIHLIILCLFMYSFLEMMPKIPFSMNYVSWFCVLFFIGSYLRFYSESWKLSVSFWSFVSIVLLLLGIVTICVGVYLGKYTHYFVGEVNRFLALGIAISTFMTFKNLKMKHVKLINTISASTFGVLLIHANSGYMRQWLWNDTLNVKSLLYSDYCVSYSLIIIFAVFFSCSIIDIVRKNTFEKILVNKWLNRLNH